MSWSKSLELGLPLRQSVTNKQKKQKNFPFPGYPLTKNLIPVFGFYERTQKGHTHNYKHFFT